MPTTTAPHKGPVVLIDADGILYAAALKAQAEVDGEQLQMLSDDAVYHDCRRRIDAQSMWAGFAMEVFVCLSDRNNFRKDILPSYKGQRKGSDRPVALDQLREDVVERGDFKVKLIPGLEADDVCGIAAGGMQAAGYETIIISADKDLLQIPGKVIVPTRDGSRPVIEEVTQAAADRWHMTQTLTGDVVDNYKGCPGWGPVRAGLLMDDFELAELSPAERWAEIIDIFVREGLTEDDCRVQAQVSRILRFSDWDAKAKAPILFQFPSH